MFVGEEKDWAGNPKPHRPCGETPIGIRLFGQRVSSPQPDVILASIPPKHHLLLISEGICLAGSPQALAEEGGRSQSPLPRESNVMSFRARILPPNPSFFDKSRNHPLNLQTAVQSLYITLKIN